MTTQEYLSMPDELHKKKSYLMLENLKATRT